MGFAERLRADPRTDWSELPGRVGFAAWELDERELVAMGEDRGFHAASTIKTLVLIAALRQVADGRLALGAELLVPTARAGGFGILRELRGVHRLPLADLLTLVIVISDNAAANVVIDAVGLGSIAACARDLGCPDTRLQRRFMGDRGEGRIVTTAGGQARVLDGLATGRALPPELTAHAQDVLSRQQVRDRLPALLPEGARCWNKTGELLGARHDVGIIGRDHKRAVVAVLVDELSDGRSTTTYRGGPACDFIAEIGSAVYRALG